MVVVGQNLLVFGNSKGILCGLGGGAGKDSGVSDRVKETTVKGSKGRL